LPLNISPAGEFKKNIRLYGIKKKYSVPGCRSGYQGNLFYVLWGTGFSLPSSRSSAAEPAAATKASPASSKATAPGKPATGTAWGHEHQEGDK
jgi:hypothetical protein